MNTNFYSLWFDPTRNQTRVFRFSSRRCIHSTTDRKDQGDKFIVGILDCRFSFSVIEKAVFPLSQFLSAVVGLLAANNFWQYNKHNFWKVNKIEEI